MVFMQNSLMAITDSFTSTLAICLGKEIQKQAMWNVYVYIGAIILIEPVCAEYKHLDVFFSWILKGLSGFNLSSLE